MRSTEYIQEWERQPEKIRELQEKGIIVHQYATEQHSDDDNFGVKHWPHLLGKVAAVIDDIKPAKEIMDEMVEEAVECLQKGSGLVVSQSRL